MVKRRNEFLEHLESLACQLGGNAGYPGRFATGSRNARYQTLERVAGADHDGNGVRGLLGRSQTLIAGNEQHVYVEAGELARQFGQPIEIALRPSDLDMNILSLDIAQLTQSIPECLIG